MSGLDVQSSYWKWSKQQVELKEDRDKAFLSIGLCQLGKAIHDTEVCLCTVFYNCHGTNEAQIVRKVL